MIYCGVDGGGTKTKLLIANEIEVIATLTCGPTSIDTVSIEEMFETLENCLNGFYETSNIEKIDKIYLGLGGIASDEHIEKVNSVVRNLSCLASDASIGSGNDITNAYKSACSGRNSIALIIGTGSVAYGVDEENNCHRASGIHFKEGDFGSAYDVGIRAMKYVSMAFDGRVEESEMTKYIVNKYSLFTISDLIIFFDTNRSNRTFIASFAKDVCDFAVKGDIYAINVIDEATEEMMVSIKAVDSNINLLNREIGVIGSLGNNDYYFKVLKEKVLQYDSRFNIHGSENDAEVGSLLLAKEL